LHPRSRRDEERRQNEERIGEVLMNAPGNLLALAIIAVASPAAAQQTAPAVTPVAAQNSVPDFSGVWRHGSLPWFVPPASGPGPVTNKARRKDNGQSDYGMLVGDYTNPILQPWAADVVKKKGELSLAGVTYPSPANQCWPEPVPFLFKHMAMEMLQLPDKIVMLFNEDHEVRWVALNKPHPAKVTPSWHGDAVARYEGDTLVVDTVGIKVGRFSMIDWFGTPFTQALHVVERFRLIDYEAVREAMARDAKEHVQSVNPDNGPAPDLAYKGKGLQVEVTIEDAGAFTTLWSAKLTLRRARDERLELVCAENRQWYPGTQSAVPTADKPDF
jgi:hypothetical protein